MRPYERAPCHVEEEDVEGGGIRGHPGNEEEGQQRDRKKCAHDIERSAVTINPSSIEVVKVDRRCGCNCRSFEDARASCIDRAEKVLQ